MSATQILLERRAFLVKRVNAIRDLIVEDQKLIAEREANIEEDAAAVRDIDAALARLDPDNYAVGAAK